MRLWAARPLSGEIYRSAIAITEQNAAAEAETEVMRESSRAVLALKEEVQEFRHEMRWRH